MRLGLTQGVWPGNEARSETQVVWPGNEARPETQGVWPGNEASPETQGVRPGNEAWPETQGVWPENEAGVVCTKHTCMYEEKGLNSERRKTVRTRVEGSLRWHIVGTCLVL